MDEEREAAEKDVRAYAEMRLGNVNDRMPEGFKIYLSTSSVVNSSYYGAPLTKAAAAHEKEIRDKRKAAIETILVELELGATKADLERLIEEAIM